VPCHSMETVRGALSLETEVPSHLRHLTSLRCPLTLKLILRAGARWSEGARDGESVERALERSWRIATVW
jgi:hypothetical protein